MTAETVQGCGSYKERATFLHSLVQLVTAAQELLQPSSAPTHSFSPQASPTTAHGNSGGSQPHAHEHVNEGQAQAPLAREARVLELACERVGLLTQESVQFLPAHVTQALQPLM